MKKSVKVVQISSDQTLNIRNTVLRPGKDRAECVYEGDLDSTSRHFGAYIESQLVGIVSMYTRNSPLIEMDNGFQIRAMATMDSVRGLGIGNLLLTEAERFAIESGAKYIWANARVSALGFYQKSDYAVCSEEFDIEDVGPHQVIVRTILEIES